MTLKMQQGQLAIVIPVWNLPEDLAILLDQIATMGIFSQVIIADDASEPACTPQLVGFGADTLGLDITYLRSPTQKGAGHARNMGLDAVRTDNVLFFDADDRLCADLPLIWQRHLQAEQADFTIFRHSDTRVEETEGRRGTFQTEEAMWNRALAGNSAKILTAKERQDLIMISAYPWNKIYRTAFLRDNDIRCSETPVHNDISLHWLSFLKARQVQALDHIGALHVIGDRGHHLTSRTGEERLCLGGILSELTEQVRQANDNQLMSRFIHFLDDICRWNLQRVDPDLVPLFQKLATDSYLRFTPAEFQIFSAQQPDRAADIVQFLLSEGA